MENKPALTSEQRLAYIGDMADIETREFTMRKSVEKLESNIKATQYEADRFVERKTATVKEAERRLRKCLQDIQELTGNTNLDEPTAPVEPKKPECWDEYVRCEKVSSPSKKPTSAPSIGCAFGLWIVLSILFAMIYGILKVSISKMEDLNSFVNILSGIVVLAVVSYLIMCIVTLKKTASWRKHSKKWSEYSARFAAALEFEEEMEKYQKNQENYRQLMVQYHALYENHVKSSNELDRANIELNQALDFQKEKLLQCNIYKAQISALQESIQSLHSQKEDLYAIGIIPPDYREMDCVIMLHQIFRNGLKDNMADAILLYEERIFRQEIIRGIDKIYDMLGELNDSMRASMRAIESRLIEVKHELQMIGSDMSNQLAAIADNQSRLLSEMEDANETQATYAAAQEQWQREQLAETRASRYAAEAVQRSNEKYEWYMEQHRQGLM